MISRSSPEAVTNGLHSKSDKIRALARAGFLRSEIARILGIRYQHVRSVLVSAGMDHGLARCSREAPSAKQIPAQVRRQLSSGERADASAAALLSNALVLVSCVKSKRSHAAKARDLYTSPLFTMARDLAEAHGSEIRILSALYGLVALDKEIAPYEYTLNKLGVTERRAWAESVLADLLPLAKKHGRVVFLAGERYREYLIGPLLRSRIDVQVPMEGLTLGQQLSWLKSQL
jgi:hypothetical protein